MKHIIKTFIVKYLDSCSIIDETVHKNTFRGKYLGLSGPLWIIYDEKTQKQYFQFQILENGQIKKAGLVSSKDDYKIEDGLLYIFTKFSKYVFEILNESPVEIIPEVIY